MEIKKIVITGGPCGGKTTGISYIEQELSKIGYKVVFVNETATEYILNGITPTTLDNNVDFECGIVRLQLLKEKFYESIAKQIKSEKVIMICDRGVMDCKSYMSDEEYKTILKKLDLDEIQLRDTYDAVFHLTTTAKGAEEFYTTANNEARRENLQEAIDADTRTLNAWIGHPHLRVIDNSTNFEGKIKRLFREICSFLGEPEPHEIERKFLVKKPNLTDLENLPNVKKVDIIQTYLNSDTNEETRVRQRGTNGSYIYTVTTKRHISDIKRIEYERRISIREYLELLNNADTSLHQIRKTRYLIQENNQYFELDVYPFANNTAILEIELSSEEDSIHAPKSIEIIKEVTNDKTFSNYALARNIPNELN